MQEALEHYKKAVTLPWSARALIGCHEREFLREDEGLPVKAILRKDVLNVNGNKIQIRRVYLKFKFLHFYHPKRGGWVLDGDVPICMICQSFFTVFSRRHHCRLCGNIVCSYCSDMEVSIKDCPEVGRVRVCSNCYYFQDEATLLYDPPDAISNGFYDFEALHTRLAQQSPASLALSHECCGLPEERKNARKNLKEVTDGNKMMTVMDVKEEQVHNQEGGERDEGEGWKEEHAGSNTPKEDSGSNVTLRKLYPFL